MLLKIAIAASGHDTADVDKGAGDGYSVYPE
jgi:hypothetical protein